MAFKVCCSCGLAIFRRPAVDGTALNSDTSVSGYDHTWTAGASGLPFVDVQLYGASVTSSDLYSSSGGFFYELKTKPFRWSFGGYAGEHLYVSDVCHRYHAQNSSIGPTTSGHFNEIKVKEIRVVPPAAALAGTGGTLQLAQIAYARVWVDSVDVTGIVSVFESIPTSMSDLLQMLVIPLGSEILMSGLSIDIDFWFLVRTRFASAITSGSQQLMSVSTTAYPHNGTNVLGMLYVQRTAGTHRTITCAFDRQGPGGTTTLTLSPQSGWSYTKTKTHVEMVHTSSGDKISWYYSEEVPYLLVYRVAATNKPSSAYPPTCKYVPQGGATFNTLWKHSVTGTISPIWENTARDMWDPSVSAVFVNESRATTGANTRLHNWFYPYTAAFGGANENSDTYEDFPIEITVTT
jgi:hypothetical protein